jgi:Tol biopolymer transport system component
MSESSENPGPPAPASDYTFGAERDELARVLASDRFQRAPTLSSILEYVCLKHFRGETIDIKEYNIAVEALDRPPDFDPAEHSIVRVEASRLRKRLRQYYENEGTGNPLRISLARSGYRPGFERAEPALEIEPTKKAETSGTAPTPEPAPAQSSARHSVWKASIAVVAAAAVAIIFYVAGRSPVAEPDPIEAVPLTSYRSLEIEPALSPAGDRVAFVWDGAAGDNFDIYTKSLGPGDPLRLTEDPAEDYSPIWSPDGQYVVFLRYLGGELANLMQAPASGGPEVRLAEVYSPATWHMRRSGPLLAWSPQPDRIVLVDRPNRDEPPALFLFSLSTGERRRLTTPPATSNGESAPAFSPDGRRLAYTEMFGPYEHEIFVLDLDRDLNPAGDPVRITADNRWNRSPQWTSSGEEIIYASSGLWRVGAGEDRGSPRQLPFAGPSAAYPAVNHASGLLVYSNAEQDANIWSVALDAPEGEEPLVHQLAGSSRIDSQPRFSPDGRRIASVSMRSGAREIWLSGVSGEEAVQLTELGRLGAPQWSPDGSRIAFDHHPAGHSDIYVIDVTGRGLQRITTHEANDIMPSWSRDGNWIYFGSNRSGEFHLWKAPASGGEPVEVTRNGGVFGLESDDGKYLFFAAGRGDTQLWLHSMEDTTERPLLNSVNYHGFTTAGDSIYFVEGASDKTGGRKIRRLDWRQQQVVTVLTTQLPVSAGVSVSPDGKSLLYSQIDRDAADLMVVETFR